MTIMIKTTVKIDGMMCEMCEAHMNDVFRNNFSVKKVKSSHKKGESVVISEESLDEARVRQKVEDIGYDVLSIDSEPYEKKGFFSKLFG